MANDYFEFKQFIIYQKYSAFKVGTDGVLLGACADISGKSRILDIGTGTGLIAIMLAQRSDAMITAIEPNKDSFDEASENIRQSRWGNRIKLKNCSLQEMSAREGQFDLIVTNPPYFINSLRNSDPSKSASRHNYNLTHKDLLEGAERLLISNGELHLILPNEEAERFKTAALEYEFFCNSIIKIKPTSLSSVKRLILGFSRIRRSAEERILAIEKGKRFDFTDEYIALTKDFYKKF